jgi:hypothetical protein
MYPRASVRGLAAYGLVVLWLLLELRRRPPAAFARLLWLAPILLTAASIVLLLPLALVYGEARELFAENSGVIGLRLVVRLAVGFGYVALLGFIRDQLLHTGALQPDE